MANTPSKEDRLNEWRSQWSTPSSQPSTQVSSQGSKEDRLTEWRNQWSKPAVETAPSPATYKAGSAIVDALAGITGKKAEPYTPKPVVNPEPTRQQRRAEMLDERFTPAPVKTPEPPTIPNRIVSDAGMNFSNSAQALFNAAPVASERGKGLNPVTPYETQKQQETAQNDFNNLNRQIQEYDLALGMADTPEAQAEINAKRAPLVAERDRLQKELDIPTTGERILNVLKSGTSGVAGQYTDTARALYEVGQEARTARDAAEMADIERQLDKTRQQRAEYASTYGEDSEYVRDADYWIDIYEKQLAGYQASPEIQKGATRETAQIADNFQRIADKASQRAKQDLNGAEAFFVDAGINAVQMATDAAINLATGMNQSMLPLALRSFGGGTQQARQDGASINQQLLYGAASASVEVLTEKMFDGLAGIYGKGMADDMTELILEKVAKEASPEIKSALTIFLGGAGEATEEAISGRLNPFLKAIYDKGDALKQTYGSGWEAYKQSWADTAYDMLVGFAMGFAGTSVSTAQSTSTTEQQTTPADQTATPTEQTVAKPTEQTVTEEAEKRTPTQQALLDIITDGVSNSKAESIINDPTLKEAFEALLPNGGRIEGTKSEQRNIVKTNARTVINALTGNAPTANTTTARTTVNERRTTEEPSPTTAPTTETAQTSQPQIRSEQTAEVETPTQETAVEPQNNAENEAPQERTLKPTQQRVADLLAKGNDITDAEIDYILDNKSRINALYEFGMDDLGETTAERRAAVRALAEDIAHNGIPTAEAVAKINQDRTIESAEQAAKYTEEQLQEEIKAERMRGNFERVKALARQRNRLIQQRITRHITKTADGLTKTLRSATERKFVPAEFVNSTTEFIEAINELRMDPNAETKTGERAYRKFTQIAEDFARLRKAVSNVDGVEQVGVGFSDDVLAMLNNAKEILGETTWGEMGEAELTTIDNALKAMNKSITDARKVMLKGKVQEAYRIGKELENEVKTEAKGGDTALQNYSQLMERPLSFFEKLAGYKKNSAWRSVYDMLNAGQKKAIDLRLQAYDRFNKLLSDNKKYRTLRDTVEIEGLKDADGNNIKISRGMMLSLYMHLLNEKNAKHIAGGGLTIADVQDYYSNHHDKGFGKGRERSMGMSADMSKLNYELRNAKAELQEAKSNGATEEQIEEYQSRVDELTEQIADRAEQERIRIEQMARVIEEKMTPYEREFVQTTQDFFKWAQDNLNETTMDVYGFAKALVENYFPIATDSNFRNIAMDEMGGITKSIENTGILQQRTGSNSPMYLLDISDVLNSYIKDMSQISGIMPAIKNFNKVYNTSDAGFNSSLRDTMRKTFGNRADTYLTELVADLQGARVTKHGILDRLLSTTRGNFAASVLTLNARVAGSQAASWFNAASVVGWKNLVKSMTMPNADLSLIREYSPLLAARTSNKATAEFSDNRTDLASQRNRITKKIGFLLNWINNVDNFTVRRLWGAAEQYVREQNTNLDVGTDAYYKEVGRVFDEIVERTQPGYEVMQRPEILREPSTLARSLTMFMTQRLQNYNEVHDQISRATKYAEDFKAGKNGVTQEDVLEAKKGAYRAVSGMVASSLALTVMKAGVDAILHRTKNYRDKETGEVTPESTILRILDYTGESLASNILGGAELYNIARVALNKGKYYGTSVPGVDTISDTIEDILGAFKATGEKRTEKAIAAAESLAALLGGIPASNAQQFVDAALRWADDLKTGDIFGSDADFTTAQNKARLYNALEDNDVDKVVSILAQMGENAESNATASIKDHYDDLGYEGSVDYLADIGYTEEEAGKKVLDWYADDRFENDLKTYQKKGSDPDMDDALARLSDNNEYLRLPQSVRDEIKGDVYGYVKYQAKKEYAEENGIEYTNQTYKKYDDLDDPIEAIILDNKWSAAQKADDFSAMDAILRSVGLYNDDTADYFRNKDYVKGLEAAAGEKIHAEDFFDIHDMGTELSKADSQMKKDGTDTRDYSAIDALINTVYGPKVTTDDAEKIFTNYYSWFDELSEAHEAGMDAKTWYKYFDQYRAISDSKDLSATQQHNEFAKVIDDSDLTDGQKQLLKNQMLFRNVMTVRDTTYDKMVANGMTTDYAIQTVNTWAEMTAALPEGKSLTATQKAEVIWNDTNFTPQERMELLNQSGLVPTQKDFAVWLSKNVTEAEANMYWAMIGAKNTPKPWSKTYEQALKSK